MTEKVNTNDILHFESKKKKKSKSVFPEFNPSNGDASQILDFGGKKKKKDDKLNLEDDSKNDSKTMDTDELMDELKGKKKKKNTKKVMINENNVDELTDKLSDELGFSDRKKRKSSKLINQNVVGGTELNPTCTQPIIKDSSGYDYETLLTRVFTQLGDLNPDLVSDQKRKLTMLPPQMARVGTKKTSFVNFSTISRSLNRDTAHLTTYILTELGTQGSIDAKGALLIRGRYASKQLEAVLRNYCRTYVLCGTCQSSETELCKDSRLLFLHCRRCGSRFTVKTVTSGFQAVTGKRAALRAKTQ